jgi:anion-transporting  ArsA/GET3 family ATPase
MPGLLQRDAVFVTGKGGVGRTTVCAALALVAASRGRRTIVCEVGDQHRLPGLFGYAGGHGREVALAPNLWATTVDPQVALREYLSSQIPGPLARVLADSRMFRYIYAAAPGARELVTLGGIWDLGEGKVRRENPPYDLVIVDAPATGHAVAMLRTPRVLADIARVGPLHKRSETLWRHWTDPGASAIVAVSLAAEMPVNETLDLERRVHDQLGREVDLVVANGLYPRRFSAADVEALAALDGRVGVAGRAAASAARSQAARVKVQQAQLRRLRKDASAPVVTLPYLFEPELDVDDVERLAGELEREL